MSCYFRHLKSILEEAGIDVTASNKKEIDRAFHNIVGVAYKDCPLTWKRLKRDFLSDETRRRDLIVRLRDAAG